MRAAEELTAEIGGQSCEEELVSGRKPRVVSCLVPQGLFFSVIPVAVYFLFALHLHIKGPNLWEYSHLSECRS